MATLSISWTIDDDKVAGIKNDFAAYHKYQATIDGQPNPESQNAFIKRKIGEFIKESVTAYRVTSQTEAARQTAISDADSNVVLA